MWLSLSATASYDPCVELLLRPGGRADQRSLLSLFDEAVSWLTTRGLEGQWGSQPWSERPERRNLVLEMTTKPGFTIAEIGPDTVGALIISDDPPPYVPAASEPDLYIDLLLVSRRFTGRRIGSALLDHAADRVSKSGPDGSARRLLGWWEPGAREVLRTSGVHPYGCIPPGRLAGAASRRTAALRTKERLFAGAVGLAGLTALAGHVWGGRHARSADGGGGPNELTHSLRQSIGSS